MARVQELEQELRETKIQREQKEQERDTLSALPQLTRPQEERLRNLRMDINNCSRNIDALHHQLAATNGRSLCHICLRAVL